MTSTSFIEPHVTCIVTYVREEAPPLAPMFRSETQLRIMAEVYNATRPYTVTELAERAGTNKATAGREVRLLVECGVFTAVDGPGNSKLISPSDELAYAPELRRIVAYTYGLLPALRNMVADEHRVEQLWIFGSWARRYHGERGHFPRDIDIIVVTDTTRFDLALPWLELAHDWNIEINTVYRRTDQFTLDDPLWEHSPMVQIK